MKLRIEGFLRFKNAKGDMNEFAHHGTDNDLGWFSGFGQAMPECSSPGGFCGSYYGGHIQCLAQECMAGFGHVRLSVHAAARLVLVRIQVGKGRSLLGLVKTLLPTVVGQQDGNCLVA